MSWLSQHVHLGDLPTWVAALGALVAAGFAFGQLRALRAQNLLQQRELDSQAEDLAQVRETQRKQTELLDLEIRDRRAAQARQVVVQRFVERSREPGSLISNGYALFLKVINNSHGTISNIDGFFAQGQSDPLRGLYSVVGPLSGEIESVRHQDGPIPVARLDSTRSVVLVGPVGDQGAATATRGEVMFTDSDGRRWKIDHSGQLEEVTSATGTSQAE